MAPAGCLREDAIVVLRSTSPHFVGRAAEVRLLGELLAATEAGELRTALVCGEAGSGKSRLVNEVATAARVGGTRTLVGSCMMVGSTSLAFAPFAEALRHMTFDPGLAPDGNAGVVTPRFARLMAAPTGAGVPPESPGDGPLGSFDQAALFEDVLAALERAAAPSGLLVIIEDLHWADLSSRGLFEFLSRNLGAAPVALVGTVRTDEPDVGGFLAWLAEVQRGPRAVRIDLEPLDPDELAELVAGVLGHPPSPDEVSGLYERSGGNPFLAEELIAAGRRRVLVPRTVRGVVLARVGGLTAPAQDLLRLAAVAGVRVSHGLLAAAGGVDNKVLLSAARELVERHLLVGERSGYAFRHALTREAVYEDLLAGERQQLHRAVAQALSDDPGLGPPGGWAVSQALAEHWWAAGEFDRALPASIAAGHAAREVLALDDALGHYERALELWDQVADPETVAGCGRLAVLAPAAETASGAGDHERAIRYVDAAVEELEHTPTGPAQLALLYVANSYYLWRAGRDAEFLAWAEHAVALVPSEPPSPGGAAVLALHAVALCNAERYNEASQVAALGMGMARSVGARKQEITAHTALGMCLAMTSTDPEAALRQFEQVVTLGRQLGDADEVVFGYTCLTDNLIRLGRLDDAAATAVEATEVCLKLGALRSWVGMVIFNGAEALFLAGRWDACHAALGQLRDQRCGGLVEQLGFAMTALLEALRGNNEAATAAITSASSGGAHDAQAESMLCAARALIALNTGDLDTARDAVVEGLDGLTGPGTQVEVISIVALAGLTLRIAADQAVVARARHHPSIEKTAVGSARDLAARTLALRARASALANRPEVTRSHQALCDAEVGRADGRSDPEQWCRVATTGAADGGAHRVAYAQFREAEAILAARGARGARGRAVHGLTAAYIAAGHLAAAPLRDEIEALARRARIELTDQPPSTPRLPPEPAPFGLTARELDVLGLLTEGRTNPQIAETLYISRKTASHHVSSVLTKLGVASRVEAAGVAHRLGLTPDGTTPK